MKRSGRWLLWAMGVFVMVIGLLAVGVLLTPRLVSTQWAKNQIENRASTAMKRAVHIQSIDWRWTDGIRIRGLKIDDDPAFSKKPLLFVNKTFLRLDLGALLKRRLVFAFHMEGVRASIIRREDGHSNLEALLSSQKAPPESPDEEGARGVMPFFIPEDVTAAVRIKDVRIEVDDRLQGRYLWVQNAQLDVSAPSLQFGIRLSDFMGPSWGLDLNALSLKAEGNLPGFDLTLKAGPGTGKVAAQLEIFQGRGKNHLRHHGDGIPYGI